jgi:hypothetical protein
MTSIFRARASSEFDQLLDHRGRALDHLAGGHLAGHLLGKQRDAAHPGSPAGGRVNSKIEIRNSKYLVPRMRDEFAVGRSRGGLVRISDFEFRILSGSSPPRRLTSIIPSDSVKRP